MITGTPPETDLRLVVGYDGSPPAIRALDAAVNLLQGRAGTIDVVYVAHMPSMAALSPGAVTELETGFDDVEQELRTLGPRDVGYALVSSSTGMVRTPAVWRAYSAKPG